MLCPKLIEAFVVDTCIVEADISSFWDAKSIAPPSNFIKSVSLPTANSGSVLLFANQNPAVVDVAEVLPVAIYPTVLLPTISIRLVELAPTSILFEAPWSFK